MTNIQESVIRATIFTEIKSFSNQEIKDIIQNKANVILNGSLCASGDVAFTGKELFCGSYINNILAVVDYEGNRLTA